MIENLTACFDGLVDPRATRRCDHQLIDILVIAAIAVIACAESWEDIQGSRIRDQKLSVMQGPATSELHRR